MTTNQECHADNPICRGCAEVARSLGITLARPHRSCRNITLENVAEAAQHLGISPIAMFDPV